MHRKLVAEALGTALLVIVGVGTATLSFGFKAAGLSTSAGIVATALAFGFVLLVLAYTLGPISGANVNPAVTMGFVVSGRMSLAEAAGYWVAQFAGGIVGAFVLWGIFSGAPSYSKSVVGLGQNGWGPRVSMIGIGLGGAFATEVLLTFIFVTAVLVATSRVGSPGFAGLAIGAALTVVHLIGIPITGTSVTPARSLGPALIVGHKALSQVWLFIVAPLVGSALAAFCYRYFVPTEPTPIPTAIAEGDVERTTGAPIT
ncbi:MAG: aquaporin [Solirubrobacterales bacterium]|nr:aquaporin [Solirubrobacterales bacterium]